MILTVYSLEYLMQLPADILQLPLRHLPADIREKAGRFRRWQDAHACIFGKHLLMTALLEEGFPNNLSALQYNPYDRPCLPGAPDFNLTHSGNRVACVVGRRGRIGIDIEELRNLDIADLESQFTPGEWQSIYTSTDPTSTFFDYWTAKESIIKADGRGLSIPLNELHIDANTHIRIDTVTWHLRNLRHLFPGYACHIATEHPLEDVRLRNISVSDIIAGLPPSANFP
jgi:4'-phosphopantetheinyl transferase